MQCSGYQPPEYIDRGEISEKFDIFSLGVVIIKIVSGPERYKKCADMRGQEFIDLVRNCLSFFSKFKTFKSNTVIFTFE
jgi:serine/threonine protein kinase